MTEIVIGGVALCSRFARVVGELTGWRRAGLTFAAGVLSAAALPPVHALPALLLAFPVLVWLLDYAPTKKRAFLDGWWFGFGHFVAGLYWIGFSLLVDAERFAWLLPFAVLCIPAVLALYTGCVAALARWAPAGNSRVLALAAAWTLAEWVRGQLFTGFSWNAIGIVWTASDATIQFAAVGGMYALSMLTIIIAASPATLGGGVGWRAWILPVGALLALFALWLGGTVRLSAAMSRSVDGVLLRVVQPNIPQRIKWRPALRDQHFATYLRLSSAPSDRPVSHIVWPETAVPFDVSSDHARRRIMASAVPKGGLLLTGALRATSRGERPFRIWNSFYAINNAAEIVATYDKFHLVPFGEYVPFRRWLGISKLTAGRTDFSAGPGPQTIRLPGLPPVGPLICYEVIFPDRVIASESRPQWLLNVTNDAWFGNSSGPYQHFAMARLRAVEQGLPLVRAANTGISGVIDAYGRIRARLGLERQGVIDVALPRPAPGRTLYSRFGDLPVLIAAAFLLVMAGVRAKNRHHLFL